MSNQKHLTLSDRNYIEQELNQGSSFKSIANALKKDPSTISKEVKKHRSYVKTSRSFRRYCNICRFWEECRIRGGDNEVTDCTRADYCSSPCRKCWRERPEFFCKSFSPFTCDKPNHPPYVCNSCEHSKNCKLNHYVYFANQSQKEYEKLLVKSRQGINMTPEELEQLNELISPLVLKGQPLSHIFAVHADEIPVCRRTLYNYFDQCVFKARNIDLPRRVRYKKRKKRSEPRLRNIKQVYRNKRTYVDFERFMEAHPDLDVVEMDTVKGSRAAGKCLLTLLFRSCSFMIIILLTDCTQRSVVSAINNLCDTIGIRTFKKYFPVILTDNGSEFKNPWDIEKTEAGTQRTYVFYCDPYVSNQKGRLEKNHEYIRYVIPKGRSMFKYTQEDINLMASHINSTARDSLNGATPFDLAELLLDKKIPILTGQHKVSPDSVMLKPALIEHRD
ncbi:IS30 family transposase [Pseudobutyrivibrio sp.]|uniref:IS30 family transposase n=1 Tax=Pseudobutyrivibrio sp. TaxID=2014367 RepID=UPI0038667D57